MRSPDASGNRSSSQGKPPPARPFGKTRSTQSQEPNGSLWTSRRPSGQARAPEQGHPEWGESWKAVQHGRHRKPDSTPRAIRPKTPPRTPRLMNHRTGKPHRKTETTNRHNDTRTWARAKGQHGDAFPNLAERESENQRPEDSIRPGGRLIRPTCGMENLRWQRDRTRRRQLRRNLCATQSPFRETSEGSSPWPRGTRRRGEPIAQGPEVETG